MTCENCGEDELDTGAFQLKSYYAAEQRIFMEMKRDAARYRILRDDNAYVPEECGVRGGDALDKLCDQLIAERNTSSIAIMNRDERIIAMLRMGQALQDYWKEHYNPEEIKAVYPEAEKGNDDV